MRMTYVWLGAALLVTALLAPGCGKKVREAAEVARVAADARDGDFTVRGEDGKTMRVETDQTGDKSGKWTMSSDKGTVTAEVGGAKVTEEDVGIAFYPGAEVGTGTRVSSTGEDKVSTRTVELLTDDPVEKVASFYKDKYAQGSQVIEQGASVMIMMATESSHRTIGIMRDEETGRTKVAIQVMEGL